MITILILALLAIVWSILVIPALIVSGRLSQREEQEQQRHD